MADKLILRSRINRQVLLGRVPPTIPKQLSHTFVLDQEQRRRVRLASLRLEERIRAGGAYSQDAQPSREFLVGIDNSVVG